MKLDPEGLEALLSPIVEGLGFTLWGVEYRSTQKHAYLKVFIDHKDGVTIDHCSDVSHQISGVLDVEDPINVPYTLEVSSPGIERPLMKVEHYRQYVGSTIKVRLSWAINNRKNLLGTLIDVNDDEFVLEQDGERVNFPLNAVKRANLMSSEFV